MTVFLLLGKNELIFLVAGVDFDSEPPLRGLFLEEVGVSPVALDEDEEIDDERKVRVCSLASSSASASSCSRIRSNSAILACSSF